MMCADVFTYVQGTCINRTGVRLCWYRKSASSTPVAKKAPGGGSSAAGMWRFYTEDSPGIKVYDYLRVAVTLLAVFVQISVHSVHTVLILT